MQDDLTIIERVLAGETEAFREIVHKYEIMVATVVRNMINSDDAARDVGQEVFIRLYRSLEKFRGEAQLSTYIGRIAINLSLNELKRQKRRNHQPLDDVSEMVAESGDMSRERFETRELINKGLQKLPDHYRAVVVLRMIEGYSTKETAEILNVPQGTVLSRLARAQDKLKEAVTMLGYEK